MVASKNKKIGTLRNILNRERKRAEHNYKRMQQMLRKQYADTDTHIECPVCYDEICPDKLIIPNCCHSICLTCVSKCDSCPLCRDVYDPYIESDLS